MILSKPWSDAAAVRTFELEELLSRPKPNGQFQASAPLGPDSPAFRAIQRLSVGSIRSAVPLGQGLLRPVDEDFEPVAPVASPVAAQLAMVEEAFAAEPVAEIIEEQPAAEPMKEPTLRIDEEELARVRAEAFAAGLAEGRRSYEQELDGALAHVTALLSALEAARRIDTAALGEAFSTLVTALVEQVVEAQISLDPSFIVERVDRALEQLAAKYAASELRLHPSDVALIEERLALQSRFPKLALVADPTVRRGSLRLTTAEAELEDRIEDRLAQLRAALVERASI